MDILTHSRSCRCCESRPKENLLRKVIKHFEDKGVRQGIAVWGLAFKPRTDDMREAPSTDLINGLIEAGASVVGHDPEAMENAKGIFGDALELRDDHFACLEGADALCICTEWSLFRRPDFDEMSRLMGGHVIFDGRNLYDHVRLEKRGFTYYAIGRGLPRPSNRPRYPLLRLALSASTDA